MFEDFNEDDYDNSRHMNKRNYNIKDIREAIYKVSDIVALQDCDNGVMDDDFKNILDEIKSKLFECLELLEDI